VILATATTTAICTTIFGGNLLRKLEGDSVALCLFSEQGSGSKRGLGCFVFLSR
jgi:hypothetical protein